MSALKVNGEIAGLRVPIRLERRNGRKLVVAPDHVQEMPPRRDETLIRALVKAHRWRRRIESGEVKSITDLAAEEGVTNAYVCRLLKLTCIAPDLLAAILDGQQPPSLVLEAIKQDVPVHWKEQRRLWC